MPPPPNTPRNLSADLSHLFRDQFELSPTQVAAPPNSPATSYGLSPRTTARGRQYASLNHHLAEPSEPTTSSNLNMPQGIDFRTLTYLGTVDENLMCPICYAPLVDPVDTECDHTFCRTCIAQALFHSEHCPIDRYPLSRHAPLSRSHKIVINQLDALLAKCVYCDAPIPRSMLQNHVERYCKDALIKCPGKTCDEVIKRNLFEKGCLHYDVTCPDCDEVHQEISMGSHRELLCKKREKECEHCGIEILRCKEAEHIEVCPDVTAPCKWAEYGCNHESKRGELHTHADVCSFKLVGPMADMLKNEIGILKMEIRDLTGRNELQERRIEFLEGGQQEFYQPLGYSGMSGQARTNLQETVNAEPLDSANEYMLSLFEALENRVNHLSAGLTDLEAKQTVMLFNETIPIRNELAEMRSTQQVVSMHVRWLLNFRRQENQKRFIGGGGPGTNGGSDGGGSSSDSPVGRRLSDSTTRDIMTRL